MISQRRYDLDWLRVIVFGLLILYHIGMFYVTWGFHVKSVHSSDFLEPAMKLLNPWRLSLLFVISGVAVRFAIDKQPLGVFTRRRTWTLLLPIVFGMVVIVAPQSWLELLEKGEISANFWNFYPQYISASPDFSIIVPTWNHLWYVVYILVYTLLLVPLARPLSKFMNGIGANLTARLFARPHGVAMLMLIPAVLFAIHHFYLRPKFPSTHALIGDWANHQLFLSLFILGFLIAKDSAFWAAVERALKPAMILTVILALLACFAWVSDAKYSDSSFLVAFEFFSERLRKTAFAWFAIVALLAMAQKWLNKPSPSLKYMSDAIFSWYIVHQTLIVMFGYWLTRQGLPFITEILLLCVSTYLACYLLHEYIIRRISWVRPLFGMKFNQT